MADNKQPRFAVKTRVLDSEGKPVTNADGQEILRTIGAAWPHRTGTGFNITLWALPMTGRLSVFEVKGGEE